MWLSWCMARYRKMLKPIARQNRCEMTQAEKMLWAQIRGKRIGGVQFYRQRPVDRFIVDFFAANPPLVIEVDGKHHHSEEYKGRDEQRDVTLTRLGYQVLRFKNDQILHNLNSVLNTIWKAIKSSTSENNNANP